MQLIRAASISLGAGLAAFVYERCARRSGGPSAACAKRALGKYQLEKDRLRRMGVISARSTARRRLRRTVAVKLLHPHLADSRRSSPRFAPRPDQRASFANVVQISTGRVGDALLAMGSSTA
jgi:hypothetical protein